MLDNDITWKIAEQYNSPLLVAQLGPSRVFGTVDIASTYYQVVLHSKVDNIKGLMTNTILKS